MQDRYFEWSPCFSLLTYKQYVMCGTSLTISGPYFSCLAPNSSLVIAVKPKATEHVCIAVMSFRFYKNIRNLHKATRLSKIHLLYIISTPQRKRFHVAHASQFRRLPCNYRLYERRSMALGWCPTNMTFIPGFVKIGHLLKKFKW